MAALLLGAVLGAGATSALAQSGTNRVVLKLRDGSDATVESGELVATGADLAPLRRLLAARGVGRGALRQALSRSRASLRAERERAERRSGRRLPDLSLYFTVEVPSGTDPTELATALRALPLVESAQAWPIPAPLPVDLDPPTPDFTAMQTYTAAAPAGVGSAAVAGVAGVNGAGTHFVDIEYDWQLAHEDLELPASAEIPIGTILDYDLDQGSHGSAVLGIVLARPNGYGVTGLAPATDARVAATYTSEHGWDVLFAFEQALLALGGGGPGDVILIEQQAWVCGYSGQSGNQLGAGPVEWENAALFDQMAIAAALGVIVVEPAGNGTVNLDQTSCNGWFNRAIKDSGALMVAAGSASSHGPVSYSNYGSRVDLQGVAEGITTLGGGSLFGGSDPLQRYQSNFGGSSSASAIVAGVVLSVQGMRIALGQAPLEPLEMRDLLVLTGTPQAADARLIGPLPDLAEAYAVGVAAQPVPMLPTSAAFALGALLASVVAVRASRG